MKVEDILREERNSQWEYVETRVKNALTKVTLYLKGNDSAVMTKLLTRYKRLDRQYKLLEIRRNELNKQVKAVADSIFDAHDAVATRIITTVSETITLTKQVLASEKQPTKKVDYEKAFNELAKLVPELGDKVEEIVEQCTELIPPKDTPSTLRYTSKVEEGISDAIKAMVAKARAFTKEMFNWGKRYDAKLAAFAKKYDLKPAKI